MNTQCRKCQVRQLISLPSGALESTSLFCLSAIDVGFGVVFGANVVRGLLVVNGRGVVVVVDVDGANVAFGLLSTQHFMLDDGHGTSSSTS